MIRCKHSFETDCESCSASNARTAVIAAIVPGARVRMRGTSHVGTVNEVGSEVAYVSWDGARTRKEPLSWLEIAS